MPVVGPATPLRTAIGSTAAVLEKARGIRTVQDLLDFWPRRYVTHDNDLSDLIVGAYAVVVAEVKSASKRPMKYRKGSVLTAVVTDGRTELDITFFKPWGHETRLRPGVRAVFAGQVSEFGGRRQLAHPDYELLDADESIDQADLIPIYTRVPKMQNWTVKRSVETVLDLLDELPDPLPEETRRTQGLPGRLTATRSIHGPRTAAEVELAHRRMRFEEAFVVQAALARRRAEQAIETTKPREPVAGGLVEAFDDRMPFTLTAGQVAVGAEIATDLSGSIPMNRLLQGEVGSGKTVVALRAMLTVIDSDGQAALLAPTEVLAMQHHRSITRMLGDLAERGLLGGSDIGTRVTLLTGSASTGTRRKALLEVASGEAGIVIGTHALLEDRVEFADLALVVVDEQHRFGVEQRDALRGKGSAPPHVLVMTATPIPRTVAMTVFGDMVTSTLRELPAGRMPITSHVVPEQKPEWMGRTWERVAEEVRAGRQAYVVCPRVHEDDLADSDDVDLVEAASDDADSDVEWWDADGAASAASPKPAMHAVLRVVEDLRATPALAGLRIEVLHGQMPADDKDAVMTEFAAGRIDVLVATTVIEVGVDVANASVMVVLDADRFGVSQLHQLRGRVGRGTDPGLCLLVSSTDNRATQQRLEAVAATTDGFDLARLDLSIRREGDILGARQSGGRTSLRRISLLRDEDLIVAAHEDAFAVVEADPTLADHPVLAAAVADRLDEDQTAFLERS